ncbi:MAG: hypothetical protein Q9169_007252 [Polycauliona sp. 2 TL-2023]
MEAHNKDRSTESDAPSTPTAPIAPEREEKKHDTIRGLLSSHQSPAAAYPLGVSAAGIHALGAEGPEVVEDVAITPSESPQRRPWKRTFLMVIHLPKDKHAMRVTCLDTGADVDVISIKVVNSLGLSMEPYQGPRLISISGTYKPQWQVTVDWHVAERTKTYTSTLAVLDEHHSKDFDVLLGQKSVDEIGFYQINDKIWFSVSNTETPLGLAGRAARPSLPTIEFEQSKND